MTCDRALQKAGGNMQTAFITTAFLFFALLPTGVKAQSADIQECLNQIKTHWMTESSYRLQGKTRTETPCDLRMSLSNTALLVQASGAPIQVSFLLAESNGDEVRTLHSCRVDKEKMHFVFEEKTTGDFEKRDRVQMTLLKRHGKGISLILSKRENKILRPLQQSSLICHLN